MTKAQICNKALVLLGATTITSLDDDTVNARALSKIYETDLRVLLAECKWNFATKRAMLAQVSVTQAWEYTNETTTFAKPSDCIRIWDTNDSSAVWREEGDYIIADVSSLGVKYVYYLDDPTKYPSYFVQAFVDLLASSITYLVLNSKTKAIEMFEKYETVSLPNARTMNSQTGTQQLYNDSWIENAKRNGALSGSDRADLSYG